MVYNPNIPLPTDFLSDSQGDIKANFGAADTIMGIDHFQFSDGTSNKGKHKWEHIVEVANYAAITPAPAASEDVVYAKSATSEGASSETNLFMSPDASGNEYQLTRTVTGKFSTFGTTVSDKGWTFLPGGLLLQYGFATSNTSSPNGTVTFPVAFTSTPFSIQLNVLENSNSRRITHVNTLTSTGFTCYIQDSSGSSVSNRFYWIAIGK